MYMYIHTYSHTYNLVTIATAYKLVIYYMIISYIIDLHIDKLTSRNSSNFRVCVSTQIYDFIKRTCVKLTHQKTIKASSYRSCLAITCRTKKDSYTLF